MEDLQGKTLQVGDIIAYATSQSNSVEMKIGEVIELIPALVSEKGRLVKSSKIRVEVHKSSSYFKPSKPVLITNFNRVVIL